MGGGNRLIDTTLPNHILIEGDNLEALTALTYTHEGRIDIIYIDPPYNTGNKDFIYNDSYVDSEDSYRHSKWLSFMSKRLRIAKKLLREKGAIFISIDDNEQAALKILCDEIFGQNNFIAQIIWSGGRKNDSKYISVSHEYILCYAKNFEALKSDKVVWRERKPGIDEIYKEVKSLKKQLGRNYEKISEELKKWYKSLPESHSARLHKHYTCVDDRGIYFPSDISWPGGGGPKYEVIHPITGRPVRVPNRGWVYPTHERMMEIINAGLIHFGPDELSVPCKKTYLAENEFEAPYSVFYKDGRAATKKLRSILGVDLFQNPKDEEILARLIHFSGSNNSTILDFFAGSGSTLHATMQLNAEDGGHRQCILVTNNENGICENVTYERNKRVIEGYTKPNGEFIEGLHGNNLRYYRTAFVGRRRTPQNMRRLMLLASDMLCIKENVYTECNEFAGMPTLENGFRFFDDGKTKMLIIYNEEAIYDLVDALENMDVVQPIITYVFSPANDPWRSEFETVADKVTLTALPAAIYNAYKRVLPKPKDVIIAEEEKSEEPATAKESLFDFDETEEGGEA